MANYNGKEVEWSDMEVFINGARITKIQGISYKPTQEKEFLNAAGNEPISIQRGNKGYTGTMKLLKGAVDSLNDAAKLAGGNDLLDLSVVVVINYIPKGTRFRKTDTLNGLEFTEYQKGMEQNSKSMPIDLPFLFLTKEEA